MNNKSSKIIILTMVTLAILAFIPTANSQEGMELLNQLSGKAEAPARNTEQLTEAYQKAIDYLMPYMMAENVPSQYEPQIALQDLGSHASRPGAETERQTLAKVMIKSLEEKEMPITLKNWFVLQLERIGKAESVPALTKLLANEDKNLRDYARRALEKNPDASATAPLLKELNSTTDSFWKIGLLNSLGQRKAESAVPSIVKALSDSDATIAYAAVTALSEIGNQASVQALTEILSKPSNPIYIKAGQGLIDIAQTKTLNKQTADAGKIFDTIYETTSKNVSGGPDTTSIRIAAINGVINCNPDKGATLITKFINDENPKIRTAAVSGARLSPSDEPVKALIKILDQLKPDTQIQVLGLIGDRKYLSAASTVKETLSSSDGMVRLASINTMSKLGDTSSAETLFNIAVNGAGSEKVAAHNGLVQMAGTNVEILLNDRSLSGEVTSRVEAMSLIGEKRMIDSSKNLLKIASEDNAQISTAALEALAEVANETSIPALIDLISKTKDEDIQKSGVKTLKSALSNAKDKDTAAQFVLDKMDQSNEQIKLSLLTSLNAAGGSKALAAVTEATKSSDQTTKDQAIRTLCEWPDYEAKKELLNIASKPETSLAHNVLSIRAILQLIQNNAAVSLEDRADLCISTYDSAQRNDEKIQIISTMSTLPATAITEKLLEIAKGEELKNEAAQALLTIASSMARSNGQASQALAQEVLDLNISEDINANAQNVISGRGRGNFGGRNRGGNGNMQRGGARSVITRPEKDARLASVKEIQTQIAALKAAIEKAPDKDPDIANLEGTALTEAIEAMQPETDAINAIQAALASLRADAAAGGRGARGGMRGMNNTPSEDVLSELRVIANSEKAAKTVARLDALIKQAQTQAGGARGGMNFQGMGGARGGARGQ
ncbi:MAG: HEAT repeat domain-containing protein [Sedimentisphaerales bacterium]|nr:HEAT repeat domain-containing protein [Sedimentisphaerales bacterium]